jgi:putative PIN family toxin of toxin-antitoxin system
MKVVVDTNVIVSGLLSPYGASAEIVRMIAAADLILCYDARLLAEYKEVLLRPKFGFDPESVGFFLDQVKSSGELVSSLPLGFSLPDPDDEMFLEVALAAKVSCLITGNLKDYSIKNKLLPLPILSPSKFVKDYR